MSTLTPPPATPDEAAPSSTATPPRHPAGKAVAITAIVIGAVILGGTVVSGAANAVTSSLPTSSHTLTASTAGVTEVDVDANAALFELRFDDVDEATLQVTSGRSAWRMERDGDELKISAPDGFFGIGWIGQQPRVLLTLPQSLEGVDASLTLSAGELRATGTFGDLDTHLSAGSLIVSGEARTIDSSMSAGSSDIRLSGVTEAEFELSAGDLTAELTGSAPRSIDIGVSAGSADITVPRGNYDVRSNVEAGGVDNRLSAGSGPRIPVEVRVSAGDVTLRDNS